ncbi:MAG: sugar transferase, partial [Solirubrobacteraceae bacterium]
MSLPGAAGGPLATGAEDRARRALDLLVAIPASILTAPLVAVLAWRIRRESPGGVLFRQVRSGLDGEPFEIFKLRTMVAGAEHIGPGLAVLEGDSRITRTGLFLRRYSLDELPNLWNVLRGEMSIVGPRPTLLDQVERYSEHQRRRLEVRPGLTGWAQVNGRTSLPWSQRIELDIWYVEHRSLALDLRILAMTVGMVLGGSGLYNPDVSGGVDLEQAPDTAPPDTAPPDPGPLDP